jgi:hypothetical protein
MNEMTTRLLGRNIADDLRTLEDLQARYSISGSLIKKLQQGNKETYTKDAQTIKHAINLITKTLEKLGTKV